MKILIVAAKANMIEQFNQHNIDLLLELGYEVHVASDFVNFGSMDFDARERLLERLQEKSVVMHQVAFARGIGTPFGNLKTTYELIRIIRIFEIDLVHAQSPIGGVLGKIASALCHKKSLYTAHGLHFFKKGPLKNWLFFPIEYGLSFFTDTLILINQRDYSLAQTRLHARHTVQIYGVGVAVAGRSSDIDRDKFRNHARHDLGLKTTDFAIISVGELNENKNHLSVLKALAELKDPQIHYFIAGVGPLHDRLIEYARENGLQAHLHLMGYVKDLRKLHFAADMNAFLSVREGLGLGGLESMLDGNYILGSENTGMIDFILNDELGYLINPKDVGMIKSKIMAIKHRQLRSNVAGNRVALMKFDHAEVDRVMRAVYAHYLE